MPIDWPDNDTLCRWYWRDGLSQADIAKRLGCSRSAVGLKFKREGIKARTSADASKIANSIQWPSDETLERWYCAEGMSQAEIARRVGCDPSCVSRKIQEMDFESRGQFKQWPQPALVRVWYWDDGLSTTEIGERLGRGSSSVAEFMRRHEIPRRDRPKPVEWPRNDEFERWVVDEQMTAEEIAERLNCSKKAVYVRLNQAGLQAHSPLAAHELDRTDRRFILYTRWAIGETQREFGTRLGVSQTTIKDWECGAMNIGHENADTWERIIELGKQQGIAPHNPRRQMYWQEFLDVIGELLFRLDCTEERLAQVLDVSSTTLSDWRSKRQRPSIRHHKAVRVLAEMHGVWSPPAPISDARGDRRPEPEVELSKHDAITIAALYVAGTNPADLAMMYDVSLSKISAIVRS